MLKDRRTRIRGSAVVEFTMVGIPLICVLISTFEMARGMWNYHTLAYAVKEGARYSVVHGQNCAIPPNACTATISSIGKVIRSAGTGIPADALMLTFTDAKGAKTSCSLSDCIASYDSDAWPPPAANAPGQKVKISGTYRFSSAIVMLWPGAGGAAKAPGVVNLSATSVDGIQY